MIEKINNVLVFITSISILWLFLNGIPFLLGICDGVTSRAWCNKPTSRIGYIMPGYRFGCYMGSSPK